MTNLQLDRNNWLQTVRHPVSGGYTEKDSGYENKHDFRYVNKKDAAPLKNELLQLIHSVQKEVRKKFTFNYYFVGSCRRNMITQDIKGNMGFDFDVNFEPNDPDENYSPNEIHDIIFKAIQKCFKQSEYSKIEKSTSVITIKAIDKNKKLVKYSCDIALVYNYYDDEKQKMLQQYIRYNKPQNNYTWEYRGEDHYQLDNKIAWLKKNKLWNELRDCYLDNKGHNNDKNKHSRSIFAESINDVCNEYDYNT